MPKTTGMWNGGTRGWTINFALEDALLYLLSHSPPKTSKEHTSASCKRVADFYFLIYRRTVDWCCIYHLLFAHVSKNVFCRLFILNAKLENPFSQLQQISLIVFLNV